MKHKVKKIVSRLKDRRTHQLIAGAAFLAIFMLVILSSKETKPKCSTNAFCVAYLEAPQNAKRIDFVRAWFVPFKNSQTPEMVAIHMRYSENLLPFSKTFNEAYSVYRYTKNLEMESNPRSIEYIAFIDRDSPGKILKLVRVER